MTQSVAEIEVMDRAALIDAWARMFATPVPKGISAPFLRRFLAFEVQTRTLRGLPKGFRAKLHQGSNLKPVALPPALKPGGRILREWNGVTHVVDVLEDGFRWNGQRHSSLSAIARAITGARWSGPRFFGVRS